MNRPVRLVALLVALVACLLAPSAASAQGSCPCIGVRADRRAERRRGRRLAARGRDEVQLLAGGLHHRAALLQAGEQHRRPRRAPLDRRRPAARRGHVHRRDRLGLAGGPARPRRCRSRPGTDLRRLLPLESAGRFANTPAYFTSPVTRGPADGARAPATASTATARPSFPTDTWNASNYWVDVTFEQTPGDRTAPKVATRRPPPTTPTGVGPVATVTATFDEAIDAATVSGTTVTLRNGAATRCPRPSPTTRARARRRSRPSCRARLRDDLHGDGQGRRHRRGRHRRQPARRRQGLVLHDVAGLPVHGLRADRRPARRRARRLAVEVGMKFRATEDGFITALRFYKQPSNTGTHVGHLWTGARPAARRGHVRRPRPPSGWQEEQLAQPGRRSPRTRRTSRPTTSTHRPRSPSARRPRAPARQRPARGPGRRRERRQRRLQVRPERVPRPDLQRHQLLGRRRLHARARRRTRGRRRCSRDTPAADADRRPGQHEDHRDVRRADRPPHAQRRRARAQGRGRQRPRRRGELRRGDPHRDAHAHGRRSSSGKTYRATLKSGNAGVTDLAGNQLAADDRVDVQHAAAVPVHRVRRPAPSLRQRGGRRSAADRGRHEVPADRGRLHHPPALLQAREQHRHARRQPVDELGRSARDRHVHRRRPASGWQEVTLPNAVPVVKDTHLRRLLLLAAGLLRVRPGRSSPRPTTRRR